MKRRQAVYVRHPGAKARRQARHAQQELVIKLLAGACFFVGAAAGMCILVLLLAFGI